MGIVTLIAAGRLDERLVDRARTALVEADLAVGEISWIDQGDAADLAIEGDPAIARSVLANIEDLDFAVRSGERISPRLFVADMDSTMIGQECIDELADYAGIKDRIAAITERAMQGELDFASALTERVALLRGLDQRVVAQCLRDRVRPNAGAATLVATLKRHGALTLLVSGGFTDFVLPVSQELGFDRAAANVLEVSDGQLTGATVGEIVDAQAKRRVATEVLAEIGAGPEAMIAIGDGANDVPMVELAGLGVGYHPKPALAAVADGIIRHHDLTALLWMQAIPRRDWVI